MHLKYQLHDACCHLANMIEDVDEASCVMCRIYHYEPSDVAFCLIRLLWPLFDDAQCTCDTVYC